MTCWITVTLVDVWIGKSIEEGWVVFNAPGIENMVQFGLIPLVSEAATQDGTITTYESISCFAFREKHANWLLCSGMYIYIVTL